MKNAKILFTAVFGVGAFVAGGLAWIDWCRKDYMSSSIMLMMSLCCIAFIADIWYKSPEMKKAELFHEKKCKALKFVTEQKRGTKADFCQKYGEDVYEHCLNKGYIHEPLDCDAQNMRWEATKHADIINSKFNGD